MTDKAWFNNESTNTMGMAEPDGTIRMFPKVIHSSAIAILDPILIPKFIEQICHILCIVVDIEEDLHNIFSDFVGIDTTESQDHDAMRWCYEDE